MSAPARGLFLRAAALLLWVALRLKIQGFQVTQNSLQEFGAETLAPPLDPQETSKCTALTARMVRAAARHGIGSPSCLEESLVLAYLLRKQGIASQLRIGVKKNIPKFEAHAWVECDGIVLNESGALHDHYSPFDAEFSSLPPAQP